MSALLDHRVDKLLASVIKGVKIRREQLKLLGVEGGGDDDDVDDIDPDDGGDDDDEYEDETRISSRKNCLSGFIRSVVNCFN